MYSTRLIWVSIFVHVSVRAFVHSSSANICQSATNQYRNTCYWIETNPSSFSASQQRCAAKGGNLATIDTAETSQFLKDFMKDHGFTGVFWIGYDERNQAWNDGTPFSWTDYNPGQPNKAHHYCTAYTIGNWKMFYRWVDEGCSTAWKSLCEIQIPPGSRRQFDLVGVDQSSTVSVGDPVVVVQTHSVLSCARQCAHDKYCFILRYIQADKTCTMYNMGNIKKAVDTVGEWYMV